MPVRYDRCGQPITQPCNDECLGCEKYINAECVRITAPVGNFPIGTNLQDVLESLIDAEDGISITNVEINNDGELIIYLSDNTEINAGLVVGTDGSDGDDGDDGVGITSAAINVDGDLIITLTNGSIINAGLVVGTDGSDGVGIDTITTNSSGALVITLTDATVITLPSVGVKTYFGNSHTNPNHATNIDPLLSWVDGSVIDNKSTIIPTVGSVYFQIDNKEIWYFSGSSWVNPMSTGSYLEHTEFNSTYNSVSTTDSEDLVEYTTQEPLEIEEKYRVNVHGLIWYGVNLKVFLEDGTSSRIVGSMKHENTKNYYKFNAVITITRKTNSVYTVGTLGSLELYLGSVLDVVWDVGNNSKAFARSVELSLDTTVAPTIRFEASSTSGSPVKSNAIQILEFSVEKIKY